MKKSQILAALALAFALGVAVIPTASTYATVIYPAGTTQSKIDEYQAAINKEVNAANSAYGSLEKVNQYAALYNDIEGENGLRSAISNATKTLLDTYNNDDATISFVKSAINTYIQNVEKVMNGRTGGLYETTSDGKFVNIKSTSNLTQATLKTMTNLNRVNNLTDAYNAVKTLNELATQNKSILNTNYNTPVSGDVVSNALGALDGIISGTNAYLSLIGTTFSTAPFATTPEAYATNDLKAVSESAYDTLVNSAAWVNATDTNTGRATRYGLFMQAASQLPKYNYVKPLEDAKKEFDKISANDQDVDYAKAQEYIAAFNTAIKNYREGTSGTGNGNNTDDNKDDQKAPTTGILSDGEGSASTTVAMVAGVATALTAAGAGVVAYRNARRSSRK